MLARGDTNGKAVCCDVAYRPTQRDVCLNNLTFTTHCLRPIVSLLAFFYMGLFSKRSYIVLADCT